MELHCIIQQQSHCGKTMTSGHVMKVVALIVYYSISWTLSSLVSQSFLLEINAECIDILYHRSPMTESWDSWNFFSFLDFRLKIEMFMNEKSKAVAEHNDEMQLWDLPLLYDIKLQGQLKLISYMSEAVRAFQMKKIFWKHLENIKTYVIFLPVICFTRMDQ
jgi:hypothetical protein